MRVFVTGASGWIGSAVVAELMSAGHSVTGLARSAESAAALTYGRVETAGTRLEQVERADASQGLLDARAIDVLAERDLRADRALEAVHVLRHDRELPP